MSLESRNVIYALKYMAFQNGVTFKKIDATSITAEKLIYLQLEFVTDVER